MGDGEFKSDLYQGIPRISVRPINGLVVMTFDLGYTTIKVTVWKEQAKKLAELLLGAISPPQ